MTFFKRLLQQQEQDGEGKKDDNGEIRLSDYPSVCKQLFLEPYHKKKCVFVAEDDDDDGKNISNWMHIWGVEIWIAQMWQIFDSNLICVLLKF